LVTKSRPTFVSTKLCRPQSVLISRSWPASQCRSSRIRTVNGASFAKIIFCFRHFNKLFR
jgi:hypothetical protein